MKTTSEAVIEIFYSKDFRSSMISPSLSIFEKVKLKGGSSKDANRSYSSLVPKVYALKSSSIQEEAYMLLLLANEIYSSGDRADLSAWIDDGLPYVKVDITLRELARMQSSGENYLKSESGRVLGAF